MRGGNLSIREAPYPRGFADRSDAVDVAINFDQLHVWLDWKRKANGARLSSLRRIRPA